VSGLTTKRVWGFGEAGVRYAGASRAPATNFPETGNHDPSGRPSAFSGIEERWVTVSAVLPVVLPPSRPWRRLVASIGVGSSLDGFTMGAIK